MAFAAAAFTTVGTIPIIRHITDASHLRLFLGTTWPRRIDWNESEQALIKY